LVGKFGPFEGLSRLQLGSLNHVLGNAINLQRAIASDTKTLISLPLSEHSGHGRTGYCPCRE